MKEEKEPMNDLGSLGRANCGLFHFDRGISIHMQISGRIFCNLADPCRLLFATCNDNQVISKSTTLPTTTLTLLRCHVVCILVDYFSTRQSPLEHKQ